MPILDEVLDKWEQLDNVARDYLVPIETEAQYQAALELLEAVWPRVGENPVSPYGSLFTLLSERISAYENRASPIPNAPAHQVLAFLMEQKGLKQSALARATGIYQSNLSQVLRGKRKLTLAQIRTLANFFGVEPSVFI
jgi:HTH-type transcriptional regulator/antitoxin HigA